uniref:Uncharacterized protein n=1 Tax=Equus caballus TaxID=9796 RepID=A0A9L0TCP1_HORSE
MSVHVLCPFFDRVVSFFLLSRVSSLYFMEINPLSDKWLVNIFSQLVSCFFVSILFSVALKKLFSLLKSHLLILPIVSLKGGVTVSEKILLKLMSKSVLPIFSSRRLIVSGLIFRSLIHFEFILVCGEKEWSIFNLLHVAVHFSQHHLLRRLSFLHCRPSAPLSKISCP